MKTIIFEEKAPARYLKMDITQARGNFGSGREMYIFKVPGSETYLSGDINKDKKVDENDLTSYLNYNGLRTGDSDFDYVSIGDVNENGLIDAHDISFAATRIGDGIHESADNKVAGNITIEADERRYKAGEEGVITISGHNLANVNAFSLACFLWDSRKLSFDKVIKTMKETGQDLHASYRETSEGGLAKITF